MPGRVLRDHSVDARYKTVVGTVFSRNPAPDLADLGIWGPAQRAPNLIKHIEIFKIKMLIYMWLTLYLQPFL